MRLSDSRVEPLTGADRSIRTTARRLVVSGSEFLRWISDFDESSPNYGWPGSHAVNGRARRFRGIAKFNRDFMQALDDSIAVGLYGLPQLIPQPIEQPISESVVGGRIENLGARRPHLGET
jgi:hypothetical protein